MIKTITLAVVAAVFFHVGSVYAAFLEGNVYNKITISGYWKDNRPKLEIWQSNALGEVTASVTTRPFPENPWRTGKLRSFESAQYFLLDVMGYEPQGQRVDTLDLYQLCDVSTTAPLFIGDRPLRYSSVLVFEFRINGIPKQIYVRMNEFKESPQVIFDSTQ